MTRVLAGLIAVVVSCSGNAAAEVPVLELPIDCEIGKTCFIQQYVDADPGSGARDYTCSSQTYNGHKGTDFRVKTLAEVRAGVNVLAAADGVVLRTRDGVADRLARTPEDLAALDGRDCGNGVMIDHGDGWQTQYCHMKEGSLRVTKGATVKTGEVLGQVGYSGAAEFPHVHLGVRKDGNWVDPFLGLSGDAANCAAGSDPLWSAAVAEALIYKRGQIVDAGFAGGALKLSDLETGDAQRFVPDAASKALVAWGWAINLEEGDRVVAVLKGPDGELARSGKVMPSRKAQYVAFAGKSLKQARWPAGRYVALFGVARNGKTVLRAGRAFMMK